MKFLILMHVIGTVLGAGAATFAEIFYTRFNSDNIITDDERRTLATIYTIMRLGLFLLVISGFGFLLYFRLTEHVEIFSSAPFWAKMTIVAVLVINSLLLQAHWMPFLIGTAVSLTSWYAALTLGVLGKLTTPYFVILAYYAIAVVLVALGLKWIRSRLHGPAKV